MNRSLFVAASLAACLSVSAQTAPPRLSPLIVSADRVPESSAALPSSVTPLNLADLQVQAIPDLRSALAEAPGVAVVGVGATGAQTSVFLRGANSDQTLFVVDGVRLNTPADSYANFLGGADLTGLERVEVLLGPQSTLYGSSAMGGVVLLETAHGSGAPAADLAAEAGTFHTLRAAASAAGAAGGLGFSGAVSRISTDNERPSNAFRAWNFSARGEGRVQPWLLTGCTVRGVDSHYEEPGPIPAFFPAQGAVASGTHLATVYAEADPSPQLQSRLTAAWYQDEYRYDDGSPYDFYQSRTTRRIAEWQTMWTPAPGLQTVTGVDGEWARDWAGATTAERLLAESALALWHPCAPVQITAGLRHDDLGAEGDATTGRLGLSLRTPGGGPLWRATYGTGFEAPTPGDRFGTPPYLLPNPGVRPEKSRGWDFGFDQTFAGGAVELKATGFANRFTDLLEYNVVDFTTYAGEEINVDRASTRGAELSLSAEIGPLVTARGSYTYLEARDDQTSARLLRRPRHAASAVLTVKLGSAGTAGLGLRAIGDRVDGVGAPAPLGGYAAVRVFFRYALRPGWFVTAHLENALDRRYEETAGYPALSRAFFAGMEWRQ